MAKVGKDDFVIDFVPHHNHGSVDYTSMADGHVHQCLDVTSPPIQTQDNNHIHYTEGYVVFEDGHTHHYKAIQVLLYLWEMVCMFIIMIFTRLKLMDISIM